MLAPSMFDVSDRSLDELARRPRPSCCERCAGALRLKRLTRRRGGMHVPIIHGPSSGFRPVAAFERDAFWSLPARDLATRFQPPSAPVA
jgi:hypothetical protein